MTPTVSFSREGGSVRFLFVASVRFALLGILVLVVLSLLGCGDPTPPPVEKYVLAELLSEEYASNEAEADRKYKGKRVRITGTLLNVFPGVSPTIDEREKRTSENTILSGVAVRPRIVYWVDDLESLDRLRLLQPITVDGTMEGLQKERMEGESEKLLMVNDCVILKD